METELVLRRDKLNFSEPTRKYTCERKRANSIAREQATKHKTRTYSRMHAFAYPHHPGCTNVHYTRRVRGFRNSRERKREGGGIRGDSDGRRHEGFHVVLKISEHSWDCIPRAALGCMRGANITLSYIDKYKVNILVTKMRYIIYIKY